MNSITKLPNGRVTLDEALFTQEQLEKAMTLDATIKQHHSEIYTAGIERQDNGDSVTEAQAKAIYITHRKIERVLDGTAPQLVKMPKPAAKDVETVAQRIDTHLANIISQFQALQSLFKEMQ